MRELVGGDVGERARELGHEHAVAVAVDHHAGAERADPRRVVAGGADCVWNVAWTTEVLAPALSYESRL